jgi:hypothetical protein
MNIWERLFTTQKTPKQKREDVEEEIRLRHLERAKRFLESGPSSDYWLTAYANVLDRYKDGGVINYPISQPTDRRWGSNFPFWTSEAQLSLIRAQSRLCVATNPNAYGLLNGLTSYVIGSGYTYRAQAKIQTGITEDVVLKIQNVIDDFCHNNAWSEMEQELFWRSREDGEFFLRLFPQPDGSLTVRTVEPEQIVQPGNSQFQNWSYGIETEEDDVFAIKNYHVHYAAPGGEKESTPTMGEIVPASEVVHLKVNVKRSIKRGLSDFSYETLDAFHSAGKLRRNLGEGAAVQAAIAAIRQHDTSTASQVETFIQSAVDYSISDPVTGKPQDYQKLESGSFLDIPKGMSYVPPPGAANAAAHLSIFQALLRSAGNRHNAPEWLCSSDASNNNYSSSLTAESPFLRHCLRLQELYRRSFHKVICAAIEHASACGILPPNVIDYVDIKATAPSVETRDKSIEANANQIYIANKIKSPQMVADELGIDYERNVRDWQEYADDFGPPLSPMNPDLSGGQDQGGFA